MRRIALLLVASLALGGCIGPPSPRNQALPPRPVVHAYGPPLPAGATVEEPGAEEPREINTWDVAGSLRPLGGNTPEEIEARVPEIVKRGRVIVGVDQSQNLLSYRDALTGELEGFEADLAREIARDIFGDPDRVDFRFVASASRLSALDEREVDMVIRTTTITRSRQQDVAFSTPYLTSESRLLVMHNSAIEGTGQLPGRTVCVTDGSTALEKARLYAPRSRILKTRNWADCLVALQQHHADAIISDDTILSGIAAQDPYTRIVGESLAAESYAVAMPKSSPGHDTDGLVRQVNSTIERVGSDGTWWRLYERWFADYLDMPGPPPLSYRPERSPEEETP